MTQPAKPDPIVRARTLAADYQANPTPVRAHNAAQALSTVLKALDEAQAGTLTKATCPVCSGRFTLTKVGGMRHHSGDMYVNGWRQICEGVGQPPLATGGIVDTTTARIGEA